MCKAIWFFSMIVIAMVVNVEFWNWRFTFLGNVITEFFSGFIPALSRNTGTIKTVIIVVF
jgi:hypothetical protein